MSNQDKVKFRKQKTTQAEALLKRKYEDTVGLGNDMRQKQDAEEQYEKRLAEQRRQTRLKAIREQQARDQQQASTQPQDNADGSASVNNLQTASGAANIQNNISVNINYTVNQQVTDQTRRRNPSKKASAKKAAKQREKELMNTSLSKMLDQHLIASNSKDNADGTKKVKGNVADSMTEKIFNGEKIYLQHGAMAFKPLGMETVLESVDEQHASMDPMAWKNKIKTNATRFQVNKLAPQTTEQNIALQQRLDFASAEEFLTFGGRFSQLGLQVKEDRGLSPLTPGENAYGGGVNSALGGLKSMPMVQKQRQMSIPASKTVPRKDAQDLKKVRSKSSLKTVAIAMTPLTKHNIPEESRQVHSGLQQMERKLKAKTYATATPAYPHQNHKLPIQHPMSEDQRSNIVDSALLRHLQDEDLQYSTPIQEHDVTGASTFDGKNTAQIAAAQRASQQQQHIGPILHRQPTKNSKEIVRKLRTDMRDADSMSMDQEQIEADTILAPTDQQSSQQPLPKMPHRMRSNATFQPQSTKKIESQIEQTPSQIAVHHQEDNISQLAIDYGMHQQNKKRIQNLMALLGVRGQKGSGGVNGQIQSIQDLDLQIGDSMSNIDAVSQQTKNKQSKMASVSQRIQEIISNTNEQESTQIGTTVKPSARNNQAQFGSNRKGKQQSKRLQDANAAFENSLEAYSNMQDQEVEGSSILNQSIDGSEMHNNEQHQHHQNPKRMISNITYNMKLKNNDAHIDGLANVQYKIGKTGGLRKSKEQSPVQFYTRNNNDSRDNHVRNSMRTTNHSGLNSLKKNPKFALVRSSMFNKNPIFDRMDVQMLSINDAESDRLSVGLQSNQRGIGRDYFSVIGGPKTIDHGLSDAQSSKTLKVVRSMSQKKLRPLNNQNGLRSSWKAEKDPHTQSLQFSKGLSYVMVKGKVQPAEKYIYKSMMPYTNAQQFQSVQIKSSKDRHSLTLQQIEAQQQHSGHGHPNSIVSKSAKQKKLKGAKMTRGENIKITKKGAGNQHNLVGGSQTTRKKTVIMEMEEEYSGSDGEINTRSPDRGKNQVTWQELQEENNQMKEQILNQIAIFEQYLKVAILQHKARERTEQEEAKKYGVRHSSAENQIFKGKDFEFDDKRVKQQYLRQQQHLQLSQSGKKSQPSSRKQMNKNRNTASAKKLSKIKAQLKQGDQRIQSKEIKIISSGHHSSQPSISATTQRRSSPTRQSKSRLSKRSGSISVENADEESIERQQRASESPVKVKFIMSKKVTSNSKMRALEHLLPVTGEKMNTNNPAHITHQTWIQKIQALWRRLNRRRNHEIVRIQDEIKRNKKHIAELTRENMFELDVNFQDQRVFLDAKSKFSTLNRRLKYGTEQRQVREIQTRIRDEIAKKADFDTWGFHNHIIEYRLKVRMTEDVIDCAQRLQVRSDAKTKRELDMLQMLRDRTYDDLKYFIAEREKRPWRVWDKHGFYFKPPVENLTLNYRQLSERIEIHMQMIAYIEPRYARLVADIPPYNAINSEMIQFCTEMFGNEGWLQMFQLRQLRKQQEDQQHDKQYMPPVEHIKKFEVDPYTLQIENVAGYSLEESERPKEKWWARLPEKPHQGKLKTGYEPIIEERKRQKEAIRQSGDFERASDQDDQNDNDEMLLIDGDEDDGHTDEGSINGIARRSLSKKRGSMPSPIKHHYGSEMVIGSHQDTTPLETQYVGSTNKNRFEGDVVQHLKDKVSEHEAQAKVQQQVEAIKKSSWLQVLEKERAAKAEREAAERKQRAARLAILFEEEDVMSQDDEDLLDANAAKQDVADYIDKIDTHLQVEKRLLEAWHENDELENK